MQQGFVNFHYLGRAMIRPDGFNSNDAFKVDADASGTLDSDEAVIDPSNLYFEGISQGGIMGGALTAMSPDFRRSILNVPAINYSTLLRRSVDSDEYFKLENLGLYDNYPNELERPLLLSTMQLLWDRGEGNGYAHHMTDDPLPNTPEHECCCSSPTATTRSRTWPRRSRRARSGPASTTRRSTPAATGRRHPSAASRRSTSAPAGPRRSPAPRSSTTTAGRSRGSTTARRRRTPSSARTAPRPTNPCRGSSPVPIENIAPRDEAVFGKDPHGYPRRSFDGLGHIDTFLDPNGFILPCTDPGPVIRPCYANGWDGP